MCVHHRWSSRHRGHSGGHHCSRFDGGQSCIYVEYRWGSGINVQFSAVHLATRSQYAAAKSHRNSRSTGQANGRSSGESSAGDVSVQIWASISTIQLQIRWTAVSWQQFIQVGSAFRVILAIFIWNSIIPSILLLIISIIAGIIAIIIHRKAQKCTTVRAIRTLSSISVVRFIRMADIEFIQTHAICCKCNAITHQCQSFAHICITHYDVHLSIERQRIIQFLNIKMAVVRTKLKNKCIQNHFYHLKLGLKISKYIIIEMNTNFLNTIQNILEHRHTHTHHTWMHNHTILSMKNNARTKLDKNRN